MPSNSKTQLSESEFEELLAWLNPDRALAGQKYEYIRTGLIQLFINRGCPLAEELTDETIDRVAKKVRELSQSYVGAPEHYFRGVAKKVYMEYLKRPKTTSLTPFAELPAKPALSESEEHENILECLDRCLDKLSEGKRELILSYYRDFRLQRSESGKNRKNKSRLQLSAGALRARVFRVRKTLEACIHECLNRLPET